MTGHVLISHSAEDREWAAYLASELERQGIRAAPQPVGDTRQAMPAPAAAILLLSQASAAWPGWQAEGTRCVSAGMPLYVVRLADVDPQILAGLPVAQWTDAFGPEAQANVAGLAASLRSTIGPAAPPSAWGGQSAAPVGHGAAPAAPAGRTGPVRILGVVVGLLLIVTGLIKVAAALGAGWSRPAPPAPAAQFSPVASTAAVAPAGAVTPTWLVGTWGPNCPQMNTGGMSIMPGMTDVTGTISTNSGTGTWALSGNVMTTISAGRTETAVWTYLGPDAARVILPGARVVNLTRCNGGNG